MNWSLDINTLIQLAMIAGTAGMGWMKISVLERDLERLEKEIIDYRELKADIAVVKVQLAGIHEVLTRLLREKEGNH